MRKLLAAVLLGVMAGTTSADLLARPDGCRGDAAALDHFPTTA